MKDLFNIENIKSIDIENQELNSLESIESFFHFLELKILQQYEVNYETTALSQWKNVLELTLIATKQKLITDSENKILSSFSKHVILLIDKLNVFQNTPIIIDNTLDKQELIIKIKNEFLPIKSNFNSERDFDNAVKYINGYFLKQPTKVTKQIFISGNIKKSLCIILGNIWRMNRGEKISDEYIEYCTQIFIVFENENLSKFSHLNRLRIYFRNKRFAK